MQKPMKYDSDSIQTLKPLEAIRLKLGMYVGSADNQAVHHIIKEILSNSIDEFLAGYGKKIVIKIKENNSIEIRDYGRGIPLEKVEDVFTKTHTSGKFKKDGEAAYGASGGLNGIGAKTATATGTVKVESMVAKEGTVVGIYTYNSKSTNIDRSQHPVRPGTKVTWTPDEGVFEDNTIDFEKVYDLVQTLSYATPGLRFEITYGGEEYVIESKGVEDFLNDNLEKEKFFSPLMKFKASDDTLSVEGAMVWTKERPVELSLVNLIPTSDHGTHVTALKTTLTREINKLLGSDLKGDEIRSGWSFVLSVKTLDEPVFKGQSKDTLNMPTINAPLSAMLRESFVDLLKEHKDFFEKLSTIVAKMREKEEAVAQVRDIVTRSKSKSNPIPKKLKMALNKSGAELFLTEGDSASGSLIQTRDPKKHAIMSLRGKPINVMKHELTKVLKNQEIQDMIIALGGFGEDFKASKLAYDKIILASDQDSDGMHIQNLLLGFLFSFYPQLIEAGKVYIVKTPLYMIKRGTKIHYIFSESEMNKFTTQKSDIISRLKGLGEIDKSYMAGFMFNEKTRVLEQVEMGDKDKTLEILEQILGDDPMDRKEILFG